MEQRVKEREDGFIKLEKNDEDRKKEGEKPLLETGFLRIQCGFRQKDIKKPPI